MAECTLSTKRARLMLAANVVAKQVAASKWQFMVL